MAKTLRAWRTEQLLSTRRLAELAGTSNKTIVQLENGRQTATFVTIEKISRVLEVEPREVTEFARALDERAGVASTGEPVAGAAHPRRKHVVCLSRSGAFLSLSRRLVEADRYSVTTMIDVPATVEQIACLQPDVLVLDLDAGSPCALELLERLQRDPATAQIPGVVTGRDRRRLEEAAAGLDGAVAHTLIVAPFGRDLRELVAAVESLAGRDGAEPGAATISPLVHDVPAYRVAGPANSRPRPPDGRGDADERIGTAEKRDEGQP